MACQRLKYWPTSCTPNTPWMSPAQLFASSPSAAGDAIKQLWRDLTDGAPSNPAILPEQGSLPIAAGHLGGREDRALLRQEVHVEAVPSALIIRAREPLPAQAKCEASSLQVRHAEAAVRGGAADMVPAKVAAAAILC